MAKRHGGTPKRWEPMAKVSGRGQTTKILDKGKTKFH